jgi:hypothetical protein
VSLYDWLLFLHVLAAFAMVANVVVFTVVSVVLRRVDRPTDALAVFRVARPAGVLVIVGSMGTLVLGIWLAIYLDAYHPWDGWIVAALVLWLVAGGTGERTGKHYMAAQKLAERLMSDPRDGPSAELVAALRAPRPLVLHTLTTLSVLGILVLMAYKPGA